ncbi:diguanylate cyclase [Geomonas sp. Red69]|uniref:diguanylate cyclase n=1 Tax=Geomonas diazotrophica TaxID=2843197 RepID=A0ABX8JL87_9BACT|nr:MULTISPECIES: diguanylate cyclase [Geomonas]MBU5636362.1 diguanylate cyclase [Geomonas diazotrophica]QWV99143.1 diguanylate cyclase [Geomonas nitrogeniifigens]QXE88311.1 diguanylate cyclase [Geomonas nitrogeniifigens]
MSHYFNNSHNRIRTIDLTFSAALLLLTVMLFLSYHIRTELAETNDRTQHTYDVIMAVDDLSNGLLQAESSRRAYVLTGNAEQKARCELFAQKTEENLREVQRLTVDNGGQQQRLAKVSELIKRKLTIFKVSLSEFDRRGYLAPQQAQLTEEGTTLMTAVRVRIDEIKDHEKQLLGERRSKEHTTLLILTVVVLSGISISIILLSLSYYIARHESRSHLVATGDLQAANRDISDLSNMTQLLQSCSTLEEARGILSCYGEKLFPDDAGAIYLINASRTLMTDTATWGAANLAPFTPDQCWAMRLGQAHATVAKSDVKCLHVEGGSGTHLCIPLAAHHETLGTLYLHVPWATEPDELARVKMRATGFAEQVALGIRNLQLREQLRELSIRDPLTGLLNRRHMEESLLREISRATRTKQPLSVVMLDIDHFKKFNDTFGHEAGDHVLKEVGQVLLKNVRDSDIACRFGGEEFTLILPDADCDTAFEIGNRIRDAVKGLNLVVGRQHVGRISISAGVAVFPVDGDTIRQLLSAADGALYEAKEKGRDRIVGSCAATRRHGDERADG